jgi:LCP family protein required for cell wall assembly
LVSGGIVVDERGTDRPEDRPGQGPVYGQGRPATPGRPASGAARVPGASGPGGPYGPAAGGGVGRAPGGPGRVGVSAVAVPGRPGAAVASGKPGKRRSPLWTKIIIGLGALLVLAAGGALIAVPSLLKEINNSIKTVDLLGNTGATGHSIDGSINMLLVGLDTRDSNPSLGSRADSIIIAHVPASHDRVYLISIPRDTSVDIPAFKPAKFTGGSYKVNAAFFFGSMNGGGLPGGFQLLALTLKGLTGITFDSGLILNFDGFKDIVTKLGGVTMYVDETTQSLHHGYLTANPKVHAAPWVINSDGTPNHRIPGTTPVIYKKGTHHLSAYDALDYVRCRDFLPFTDYDRQRHQQQFIKALLKEAYNQGLSNPLAISDFLKPLGKAFTFDPGSGHTLSDWIFTLKGISPDSIITIKTNGGVYVHYAGPAPDSRQALSPDSMTLMSDVVADRVDDFIAAHPTWVANS